MLGFRQLKQHILVYAGAVSPIEPQIRRCLAEPCSERDGAPVFFEAHVLEGTREEVDHVFEFGGGHFEAEVVDGHVGGWLAVVGRDLNSETFN